MLAALAAVAFLLAIAALFIAYWVIMFYSAHPEVSAWISQWMP